MFLSRYQRRKRKRVLISFLRYHLTAHEWALEAKCLTLLAPQWAQEAKRVSVCDSHALSCCFGYFWEISTFGAWLCRSCNVYICDVCEPGLCCKWSTTAMRSLVLYVVTLNLDVFYLDYWCYMWWMWTFLDDYGTCICYMMNYLCIFVQRYGQFIGEVLPNFWILETKSDYEVFE
jgi:hypothetical protein